MTMQAGIINATSVKIKVAGNVIAKAMNGTLSLGHSLNTSVNKDDLGWEKSTPGARNWSLTGDCEFAFDDGHGANDIVAAIINRTPVAVEFSSDIQGDTEFTGNAYVESFELSGDAETNLSYSYALKGTGALAYTAIT